MITIRNMQFYDRAFVHPRKPIRELKQSYVMDIAPRTEQEEDIITLDHLPANPTFIHSFVPIVWGDRLSFPHTRFISTASAMRISENMLTHKSLTQEEQNYIRHYDKCLNIEKNLGEANIQDIVQQSINAWKNGVLDGNATLCGIAKCFIRPETLYEHFRTFNVVTEEQTEARLAMEALKELPKGSWLLRHSSVMRIATEQLKEWMSKSGVQFYTLSFKQSIHKGAEPLPRFGVDGAEPLPRIHNVRIIHWPGVGWATIRGENLNFMTTDEIMQYINSPLNRCFYPNFFTFLCSLLRAYRLSPNSIYESYL